LVWACPGADVLRELTSALPPVTRLRARTWLAGVSPTCPVASGSGASAKDTVEIVCVWNWSWKSDSRALATRTWSSRCAVISSANRSRMYAPSWSVEIVGLTATRHCWIASRSSAADW
jgi:hypothetical protein